MGAPRAPYMAKTDKERLATGFWNRIESNQATDYNKDKIAVQSRGERLTDTSSQREKSSPVWS